MGIYCAYSELHHRLSLNPLCQRLFWYSRFSTAFSSKCCISSSSYLLFISNSIFCDRSLDKKSFSIAASFSAFSDFRLEVLQPLSSFSLRFPNERRRFCPDCELSAGDFPSLFCRTELLYWFDMLFSPCTNGKQTAFNLLKNLCCSVR